MNRGHNETEVYMLIKGKKKCWILCETVKNWQLLGHDSVLQDNQKEKLLYIF